MANVVENTGSAIEAAPVLFQVIFHQDNIEASPAVPTNDAGGIDPPASDGAAPVAQVPTETTNGHRGKQIKFQIHTTNGQSWRRIRTCRRL